MEERIETMENNELLTIEDAANGVEMVEVCEESDNDVSFAFAAGVAVALVGGIVYKKAVKPGWKKAKAWVVEKLAEKDTEDNIIDVDAEEVIEVEEVEEFFEEEIPDIMESKKKNKKNKKK